MEGPPTPANRYGTPAGGVRQSDVSHAADALLRAGDRPSVEKIRIKLGRGSPNTINPLLDAWWKTLSARLDAGPAALHRLPETVAHVAEALWMQALEEGRRRAHLELKTSEHLSNQLQQNLEVRSHVLTLREGELDSRLRDRDRTIEDLNLRLRELTGLLRKEQATRELLSRQIAELQSVRVPNKKRTRPIRLAKKPKASRLKPRSGKRGASKRARRKRRRG
jgi:Plasmid replication region DNA-binding N-term